MNSCIDNIRVGDIITIQGIRYLVLSQSPGRWFLGVFNGASNKWLSGYHTTPQYHHKITKIEKAK